MNIAIPDDMAPILNDYGVPNPDRAELTSHDLAFYFQEGTELILHNMAGCHFTDELEKALEDYYGIDRFTLYQGSSECAFSAPARTWNLIAYTDEWGDMWLSLTPLRTASRRVRADEDVVTFTAMVPDIISEEWSKGEKAYFDTPDQMSLNGAIVDRIFELPQWTDPDLEADMDDVCSVMCGYYGLTPDEFYYGPSDKCFAKMSHTFTFTVNTSTGKVTCSL